MAGHLKTLVPKRGEVYMVNLDPAIGSEIRKMRPALILQNDIANRYSPITIVAAITSQFREPLYPTDVFVASSEGRLEHDSVILLNQVRSIDKQRLVRKLGHVEQKTMMECTRALRISLGFVDI